MIIKSGAIYRGDGQFHSGSLFVEKNLIVENPEQISDTNVIDAEDLFVFPGLIDIHSHGAAGHDFSDGDPEGLKKILAYELAHGITSYCPTAMSLPKEKLLDILKNLPDDREEALSETAGINLEGPFLNPMKKGAHRKDYLSSPDSGFLKECMAACKSAIRLVTLAPELKGALDLIREWKGRITISLGHSCADYETARAALAAGADHITHLFNAMEPFEHRAPGLIGAASEDKGCMAELICDGVHVHESAVRAAFRLFPGRIVLISDSMRAAGMGDGTYELGGQQVTVSGPRAVLNDGTIAGSVTNLYDCMRNAVSFGIPIEEAIAAATLNPAKSIGISDRAGSLAPGKRADILLADKNLNLVSVIHNGRICLQNR